MRCDQTDEAAAHMVEVTLRKEMKCLSAGVVQLWPVSTC